MDILSDMLMDDSFNFIYDNLIKPFPENRGKVFVVGSFLYNSLLGIPCKGSDLDIAVCDYSFFDQTYSLCESNPDLICNYADSFIKEKLPDASRLPQPWFSGSTVSFEPSDDFFRRRTSASHSNNSFFNPIFHSSGDELRFVDISFIDSPVFLLIVSMSKPSSTFLAISYFSSFLPSFLPFSSPSILPLR